MMTLLPGQEVCYGKANPILGYDEDKCNAIITAVQDIDKGVVDLCVNFPKSIPYWDEVMELRGVPYSETPKPGHWSLK